MDCLKKQLAREIIKDCKNTKEAHSIIKEIFRDCLEEILQNEIDEYMKKIENKIN